MSDAITAHGRFHRSSRHAKSWSLILDTALDAVIVMNSDGNVVDWNEKAFKVFGWTKREALGRNMADLIIPAQFREAHLRGLNRFLKTGEAKVLGRHIEIWGLRKSEEEFPVELSITQVSDADGFVFVGFLRDITDRKRAEHLREQNALKMEVLYRIVSFAAETNSFHDALQVCLESVLTLTGWPLGHVYLPSNSQPTELLPSEIWSSSQPDQFEKFRAITANYKFRSGEGLPGKVWATGEPLWISNVDTDGQFPRARPGAAVKSAFGFPIKARTETIAIMEFFTDIETEPDPDLLTTLRVLGDQVGRVFERKNAEQVVRNRAEALEIEVGERKRTEQHNKLLIAEINHRSKNTLAVVSAIASQTLRNSGSLDEFGEKFIARLRAFDHAHSLLTAGNWEAMLLQTLIEEILSPHRAPENPRIALSGPFVELTPKAALSVAMILHELATNAVKYGALSRTGGKLSVQWAVQKDVVRISWIEAGVGAVSRPTHTGFGTKMIEISVQHELRGKAVVTYGNDGIEYDISFPVDRNAVRV